MIRPPTNTRGVLEGLVPVLEGARVWHSRALHDTFVRPAIEAGLAQIHSALAHTPSPMDEWQRAIDEELIFTAMGTTDTLAYREPRRALQAIIRWHISVALNPAVSSDAQALVDRGRSEAFATMLRAPSEPPRG